MRENSFGDYLEKKRAEYSSHSELYKGYFNDNFEKELNKISAPVVHRDIKIGKEISIRWKQDLEEYSDKTIWRNILDQESSGKLQKNLLELPDVVLDHGKGIIWPLIDMLMMSSSVIKDSKTPG